MRDLSVFTTEAIKKRAKEILAGLSVDEVIELANQHYDNWPSYHRTKRLRQKRIVPAALAELEAEIRTFQRF